MSLCSHFGTVIRVPRSIVSQLCSWLERRAGVVVAAVWLEDLDILGIGYTAQLWFVSPWALVHSLFEVQIRTAIIQIW